jgi:hypothetical protein
MWTGTYIVVTGRQSGAYVSPFIQNYLFIRTYMSALVDLIRNSLNKRKGQPGAGTEMPARLPESGGMPVKIPGKTDGYISMNKIPL